MKQLVEPNLNQAGRIGWCLQFARQAYGAPVREPSAWVAWLASNQRTDAVPTDVKVPLWFSYIENGVNLGHVVISVPGRGYLSSPWKQGTTQAWLSSISEVERIYKCQYVGWSEDISGVTVVGDEMVVDKNNLKYLYMGIYGQDPSVEVSPKDPEIGKDYAETTQRILDYANKNGFAYWQFKPQAEAKISDLTKENEALKKQLSEAGQNPDSVTVTKQSLWDWFKNLPFIKKG